MTDAQATERDLLDFLLRRYTDIRRGTIADRWTRAENVALLLGDSRKRVADFVAADKYPGIPYGSALALHGHEVKVSRSDWLTELRDLTKAEAFKRYMHHWWLVAADKSIVNPGELPDGWGLLVKAGNMLRAVVKAPRLSPDALPTDLAISLMASAARTAHRDPLRRDAPRAHLVTDWTPRCGFCGEPEPCAFHQPRAEAARVIDRPA
jgi:hypothetical protein